jgi:hypothetical protein
MHSRRIVQRVGIKFRALVLFLDGAFDGARPVLGKTICVIPFFVHG